MPKFIKQYQNIIHGRDAKEAGFVKTKDATGKILNEFFEDIVAAVMSDGDKTYLIQWAISEIDKSEIN